MDLLFYDVYFFKVKRELTVELFRRVFLKENSNKKSKFKKYQTEDCSSLSKLQDTSVVDYLNMNSIFTF